MIGLLNNKSIVCKHMSSIFLQAKVIRTRSTESMPFPFSFMMVVVSFLWLCYGTVVNDRNIQVTRHSLTPNTKGSQLGRNIYGWNTQMYVVTSLQGERKIHLVPDIVLCWPLLHSRCQTPFWILSVAGNYLYASCEDERRQTFPQTYINEPARKLFVC